MKKTWWWLSALVLAAALLRLWGIDFGLPNLTRPDEQNISLMAVNRILRSVFMGAPDLNPHFFQYPSLYIYLLTALYSLQYLLGHLTGVYPDGQHFVYAYLDDFTPFHLISRYLTALLGITTVPVVWACARNLFPASERPAWIAGVLMAVCYLHVRDSHFGVTDVPVAFFVAACLWFSARFTQKQAFSELIWSGVFAGLAAGTKYPGVLVGVVPVMVLLQHYQSQKIPFKELFSRVSTLKRLLLLAGVMIAVFILTTPYFLLDNRFFWQDFSVQRDHLKDGHFLDLGIGWIYHLRYTLWHALGPLYLIAGLTGLGWAAVRLRGIHLGIAVFAVMLYVLLGNTKTVFLRYMIPLLPVFALYAAFAVELAITWLTSRWPALAMPKRQLAITVLLTLLVGGWSLRQSLAYDAVIAQPDTRTLARDWMMKRLKPNDAVGIGLALSHVDLPYSMNKYFLSPEELPHVFGRRYRNFRDNPDATVSQHPSDRHEFNVSTYSQPKLMKQLGIRYFVVGETPLTLFTTPEFEMKRIRTLYKPVVRFSPLKNERSPHTAEAYDQLDAFYIPFTDPAMIQRPGPTITIYQVR